MSTEDSSLKKIILASGTISRIRRAVSIPFSDGSLMSSRIKSGSSSTAFSNASNPSMPDEGLMPLEKRQILPTYFDTCVILVLSTGPE